MLAAVHVSMLAHGWTLTREESTDDSGDKHEVREYTGEATLVTDGSGRWGATAGLQVKATCITIVCDGDDAYMSKHVGVQHEFDESAMEEYEGLEGALYTDKGLTAAVSKLLGHEVDFTESGMQDEFYMSME